MNSIKTKINKLLSRAALGQADEVRHLGHGEFNDSYYVRVDNNEYCLRIAKYKDNPSGLAREADAICRLPKGIAPSLVYFSDQPDPIDCAWIIETYIEGSTPKRLSLKQFHSMGYKLAQTHAIAAPRFDVVDKGEATSNKSELWEYLSWCCRSFYPSSVILTDLPDIRITRLAQKIKYWFAEQQKLHDFNQPKCLLHKDITPSNVLVNGDEVFLIDWEIRDFGDPMADFATGFWDIELNNGKWRITLNQVENKALYQGYSDAGGAVDHARIETWVTFDKLGVAVFLCHRIHSPTHDTTPQLQAQYKTDLEAIIASLSQKF